MSKRKPLPVEEKSIKLLEIFHESCDVFQLKDLERIAPKEKGIVMQSVKGTLQELVNNDQVRSEKIAGSIYFWAFPSDALNTNKVLLLEQESLNVELQNKIENAQDKLRVATAMLNDGESHKVLAQEIEVLKKKEEDLQKRVADIANVIDYNEIAAKEQDIKKIVEAANRWTDNVYSIKSWCKRKFDKEEHELNKAFNIPEDLDYLDA